MSVLRKRDPRQVSLVVRAGVNACGPGREIVSKPKARPHRRGTPCKKYPLMHLAILYTATKTEFQVRYGNVYDYVQRYFPEIILDYTARNGNPPAKYALAQRSWRADRYDEKQRFVHLLPAARTLVAATDYAEYE